MATDGASPNGPGFMLPMLTENEMHEMRLAIKARARMSGTGTEPHRVCVEVLRKMDEAEREPMPSANGSGLVLTIKEGSGY